MSSNTRCSGLSRQRYSTSRMASVLQIKPIENVWDALGGKLLVETILRQTRTPLSVHSQEEWDKLPQQLLDNVVQKVWYDVWNVCITLHGGHIPY
ncbi:hypothetical protein TNCV_3082581 [Trichonephila clavipes]|nr:hypothetical protein TNCV_3082581 [Trichonephila clavipes]